MENGPDETVLSYALLETEAAWTSVLTVGTAEFCYTR